MRAIRHSQEYWESKKAVRWPRRSRTCVRWRARTRSSSELDSLQARATHLDPKPQDVEYRLNEERSSFGDDFRLMTRRCSTPPSGKAA